MKTKNKFLLLLAMALLPFTNVCVDVFSSEVSLEVRIVLQKNRPSVILENGCICRSNDF